MDLAPFKGLLIASAIRVDSLTLFINNFSIKFKTKIAVTCNDN